MSLEQFREQLRAKAEDAPWVAAIESIVHRQIQTPPLPCELVPELLLANRTTAEQAAELAEVWGVTHVFSCIESVYLSRDQALSLYSSEGIQYDGVCADDDEEYEMLPQHWDQFEAWMTAVNASGGRCLIHCAAGPCDVYVCHCTALHCTCTSVHVSHCTALHCTCTSVHVPDCIVHSP